MSFFVHSEALCDTVDIGEATHIWQFTIVARSARIGSGCNICSHCFVDEGVVLGDRVTVKNGVELPPGLVAGDDVFIGPNVSFADPLDSGSKNREPSALPPIEIRRGASIGGGAVVCHGVTIGENAMIGAGAVVRLSVPANAIVVGNPARIIGYIEDPSRGRRLPAPVAADLPLGPSPTAVKGVDLYRLPLVEDIRGNLTVGEFGRTVPFAVKRYFMVRDVPSLETRGEHAHRACHEFLICVTGSCTVVADDGVNSQEFHLTGADRGLHLPPGVWRTHFGYSKDAILLVFASEFYDPADYIRDYDQFRGEILANERSIS